MRLTGEISASQAADRLGCHEQTMWRWCKDRLAGESNRLTYVRYDTIERVYYVMADEISAIRDGRDVLAK